MRALALMGEPREAWVEEEEERPQPRRPDARLARLRLSALRGDVDVDAVAGAIARRLTFTASLRADLTSDV